MGIGRIGTAMYLIDGKGVIVDEYGPAYADIDLPIIDGLAASPQDGGSIVDVARAEFAGRVIGALSTRPEIAKQVSQLDVSDLHDAVVILDGDTALLRLGEADFVARLQQYLDLAPALRERVRGIDYVDLRFDERLYVRPARPAAAKTVNRRIVWHDRNATWWASTSGPPRCARWSASCSMTAASTSSASAWPNRRG